MSDDQQTTGQEPSLSQSDIQTTGLEPSLSTGYALDNLNAIRLSASAARFGNKAALRTLLNTLRYGADAQRGVAAQMLGAIDNGRVGKALIAALQDAVPVVRAASAQSLGRIGRAEYLPSLVPLLDDDTFIVRMTVARAMTNIFLKNEDDKQLSLHIVRHLNRLLRDYIPEVRETACAMLGWIATDEARDCLKLAIHDPLTSAAARQGLMWAGRGDEEQSVTDSGLSLRTIHQNRLVQTAIVAKTLSSTPHRGKWELLAVSLITALTVTSSWKIRYLESMGFSESLFLTIVSIMLLGIVPTLVAKAGEWWIERFREDERMAALRLSIASQVVIKWGYVAAVLYRARVGLAFALGITPLTTMFINKVELAIITSLVIGLAFLAFVIRAATERINSTIISRIEDPYSLPKLLLPGIWISLSVSLIKGTFWFIALIVVVLIGLVVVELYKNRARVALP